MKRTINISILALLLFCSICSCKKNYTNPAAATSDQVLSSSKGLTGLAVSLQKIFSTSRAGTLYNLIAIDGFVTNQLIILNQGNTSEYQLSLGGTNVDGTNANLGGLWTSANKIIHDADLVIGNAGLLADKSYGSGLIAYASIFKALAIGFLSEFWEKIPDGNGTSVNFIPRTDGFLRAIAVVDKAQAAITANAMSATFLANIPAGVDIINTLYALKARYSLFAGNYAQALTAANAVDLTKKSTLNYEAANLNPIFETVTSTNNVYAIIDSTLGLPVGLQPSLTDLRVPFYVATNAAFPRFRVNGFGAGSLTAWPIYLPGEITLIKAEAYARMAVPDLVNGLVELNKIVTKQPANDPFGVGANQPIQVALTQSQLLDQIYRHRAIELFMSGLKLEDMRRFGRALTERKRNFFPYPFRERDNNVNTPADPSF